MVRWATLAGGVVLAIVAVLLAPESWLLGGLRLGAYATIVAGASLLVARAGAADLALGATVAAGAYAGGVAPALLGLPVVLGLPAGAAAGGLVGACSGTVHGRLGRAWGALASLAIGTAVVTGWAAWPAGGEVAGFHAVPLPTPGDSRTDVLAVAALLAGVLSLAAGASRTRSAALAAVAVRAPQVVLALGRRPALVTARIGAVAGAMCGLGGVALAAVTGSVMPGAFGMDLAAALVLAALIGGSAPWGPLAGTAVVWGPSTLWPLAPLVGTAPPLLVAGPLGLAILAVRRGRPLLAGAHAPGACASGTSAAAPSPPRHLVSLRVEDLDLLGRRIALEVAPGEVVAVCGPNGAGKSTLLAMIGGQLDDGGAVTLDGGPAPRGVPARAAAGVARTWQQAPALPSHDVFEIARGTLEEERAVGWARRVLGGDAAAPGMLQLLLLASRRPGLALLDEPTDVDAASLAAFAHGLAAVGTGVLLADHRPEVIALADRVVELEVGS